MIDGRAPRDDDTTLGSDEFAPLSREARPIATLTVLAHPERHVIGWRAPLPDVSFGGRASVSRESPRFGPPGEAAAAPLGDRSLSRKPLHVEAHGDGGVRLVPGAGRRSPRLDGEPLTGPRVLSRAELARGAVLELSQRVVLLVHASASLYGAADELLGISGTSDAVVALRREIAKVAPYDVPVLIAGESGVGKERVAEAIHRLGSRRHGPWVAVNMAAIPTGTAASALFGHTRGAFTGAGPPSEGYFGAADGGTLFLDEVGDTPQEVQAALLRALESGEVQPVGSARPRRVDVRIIAATDRDLAGGQALRLALLQRLRGYDILVPPLRERREDVPRLLLELLEAHDVPQLRDGSWLPGPLMASLARYDWPGNVRELVQVAGRIAITSAGALHARLDPVLQARLGEETGDEGEDEPAAEEGTEAPVAPRELSDARIAEVLREVDFRPTRAARRLGISRTTLYARIEASGLLRKAADLGRAEIEAALGDHGGDVRAAARALEVSARGLRLRMKQLEEGP